MSNHENDRQPDEKKNMEEGLPHDFVEPPPAPVVDSEEVSSWSFYRATIAEFVATLLFLYITLTAIVGANSIGVGQTGGSVAVLETAWAFGGTIFVLVYCIAGLSGGHINPAITFGFLVARKVTLSRATCYITAQILGAMCGAAIARGVNGAAASENYGGGGVNSVRGGHTIGQALAAEIMGTFVLMYVVLSATDPQRNARDSHVPVLAPLPIGFAIFVIHLATIPIDGTSVNPARSLGAAVADHRHGHWGQIWIFIVGPLIGSTLAGLYHNYVLKATSFTYKNLIA